MKTRNEGYACACCNIAIAMCVDDNEEVTVDHPVNGCIGAALIHKPAGDVLAHLLAAHRAQQPELVEA